MAIQWDLKSVIQHLVLDLFQYFARNMYWLFPEIIQFYNVSSTSTLLATAKNSFHDAVTNRDMAIICVYIHIHMYFTLKTVEWDWNMFVYDYWTTATLMFIFCPLKPGCLFVKVLKIWHTPLCDGFKIWTYLTAWEIA